MRSGSVTASVLNLRDAPEGALVGKLQRGAVLTVLDEEGDWLHVRTLAGEGYVSARYVELQPDPSAPPPPDGVPREAGPGDLKESGGYLYGPDGVRVGRLYGPGLYNFGQTTLTAFIAAAPGGFDGHARSLVRVIQAVSDNEGKLEAVNTYDNSFLTFGALQWTAGPRAHAGELAALLHRLKRSSPAAFEGYFLKVGLDSEGTSAAAGVVPTGYLTLNGQRLGTVAAKIVLRQPIWAYRFWRAGHDPAVRRCEVEHAMARVDVFYRLPRPQLSGRAVGDYVTSEYGVALLLDEHVNRPGHVPGTLASALAKLGDRGDPASWTDADEAALLERYIEARNATTMTNSEERAAAIGDALDAGRLSSQRGSFKPAST
jgi:hypothetical protein